MDYKRKGGGGLYTFIYIHVPRFMQSPLKLLSKLHLKNHLNVLNKSIECSIIPHHRTFRVQQHICKA